jgi:ABC-2 type transport system ATP-binding protein
MYAIETSGLTHRFSAGEPVLRQIDLLVPAGSIYGFLGPNGAGKTTTLRLLLGLLRRQQGAIHLFGMPLERHRVEILRRVGSSIESPSLYAALTAAENLRIWQAVFRCPKSRIGEVLRLVGLADTGRKRAGELSLGMKQRLSLAVALLHQPPLLILDEPANGLDPHGILEMRDLLLDLNREQGTTILVSSHLLSEVERLVSHVGILNRGALLFQGPLPGLLAKQREASVVTLETSDNARALAILAAAGWEARLEGGKVLVLGLPPARAGEVNRELVLAGLDVRELAIREVDLEEIFLTLVRS